MCTNDYLSLYISFLLCLYVTFLDQTARFLLPRSWNCTWYCENLRFYLFEKCLFVDVMHDSIIRYVWSDITSCLVPHLLRNTAANYVLRILEGCSLFVRAMLYLSGSMNNRSVRDSQLVLWSVNKN